jgi:hypothetical protein
VEATLNGLQSFSEIDYPNESHNQSSTPSLLNMHLLSNQHVLYGIVVSVGEGEEPPQVIAFIGVNKEINNIF